MVEHEGEPIELIEAFGDARMTWLVDAVCSGAPPGSLHRFDAGDRPLPAALFRVSTHRLGLHDALLPGLEAKALLADKAFDADERVIKPLEAAGITRDSPKTAPQEPQKLR